MRPDLACNAKLHRRSIKLVGALVAKPATADKIDNRFKQPGENLSQQQSDYSKNYQLQNAVARALQIFYEHD
jgi:hypothetical protein